MAPSDVIALGLSIPLLVAVSVAYDVVVLRWSERSARRREGSRGSPLRPRELGSADPSPSQGAK